MLASNQCCEELNVKVKELESKLEEAERLAGKRLDQINKQQMRLEDTDCKV